MTGSVSQDPDSTYPSADDGAGVVELPITLSGAAFVRWELVIPGAPDIDLYLLDAVGNIVAASTSGGTDELIDLVAPADGDYTLVVHGWAVPSASLAFSIDNWIVPAASGGSLAVGSAPASAVSGTTGTVVVNWAGLAPGRYIGAVSHNDSTGPIAMTVVAVNA
ncbi:MAG: peptidase S08 family protein, partial [Acidimicrobiaceae bacterium]